MADWDQRFLDLAQHVAGWSKDPSTKVGAVIADPADRRVLSMGFNGFPRGIADIPGRLNDRTLKLQFVAHAERNALDQAEQPVKGMTLYSTLFPCAECCKSIIQRGIKRVHTCAPGSEQWKRWESSMRFSAVLLGEAGVQLTFSQPAIDTPQSWRLALDHEKAGEQCGK